MPPLLLDVGALDAGHTDCCLDALYKSIAEAPDGGDGNLWAPHPNPALAAHVEDATRRFQAILQRIQDALALLLTGAPLGELAKAEVPWLRWDATRLAEVQMHLEAIGPENYTLDDWMLAVDLLLQAHLGDDVIQTEAEHLTVRSFLAGKVQAALASRNASPAEQAAAVHLVPTTFAHVPPRILTPVERAILQVAQARTAESITAVAGEARSALKRVCIEHIQAKVLGQKEGTHAYLRQRLFDSFGVLNRDWRRVAVTEAGEACNQGFILAMRPGQRVRRLEAYRGACPFCASINGMVLEVIAAADAVPSRDGWKAVWPGKSNAGRSASPRKRVGDVLVERPESERWWIAAGVQHPNCRGSWAYVADRKPGTSDEFAAWLDAAITRATGA